MKYKGTLRRVVIMSDGSVYDFGGSPIACWRDTTGSLCVERCAAFRVYECDREDEMRVGCAALPGGGQVFGYVADAGDELVEK
jgi:hypothetical protein